MADRLGGLCDCSVTVAGLPSFLYPDTLLSELAFSALGRLRGDYSASWKPSAGAVSLQAVTGQPSNLLL